MSEFDFVIVGAGAAGSVLAARLTESSAANFTVALLEAGGNPPANPDVSGLSQTLQDYVRAGVVSPVSADIVVSSSYDKKVMMFDTRSDAVALTLDHGAPVESVIFNKSGSIIISAGGSDICFWDALAGGKLLSRITPHHKTVTCLAMASDGLRLVSGGLDKRVRVTDMTDLQPAHVLEYPSPILSIGIEV